MGCTTLDGAPSPATATTTSAPSAALESAGAYAAEIQRKFLHEREVAAAAATAQQQGQQGQQSGSVPLPDATTATTTPAATTNPNRVYVGNINFVLGEAEMTSLFASFGPVRSCQLVVNNERPGGHRGYGFIEYFLPQSADAAVKSMNGFPLAGRLLKVNYATALNNPMKSAAAAVNHAIGNLKRAASDAVLPGDKMRGVIAGHTSALVALSSLMRPQSQSPPTAAAAAAVPAAAAAAAAPAAAEAAAGTGSGAGADG